jgi:hypothetical protein
MIDGKLQPDIQCTHNVFAENGDHQAIIERVS